MNNVKEVKKGLVVEKIGESQANIFIDGRIYVLNNNKLDNAAEEIVKGSDNTLKVYLGGLKNGRIAIVRNLAMGSASDLGQAVAYMVSVISEMAIF